MLLSSKYLSDKIPILRIQISQFRLFVFRQSHIRDGLFSLSVLRNASNVVGNAADYAQTCECYADAVAFCVEGCLVLEEAVHSDDAANVAESDLPGRTYAATVMATKIHIYQSKKSARVWCVGKYIEGKNVLNQQTMIGMAE